MSSERPRALVAMSGGVDSSVAAYLTQQRGYAAIGVTMKLFESGEDGPEHGCCTLEDAEDARAVAFRLNMPYYVFNFTETFQQKVISPFAEAYARGETPNPCIECNRCLKFERLARRAEELGCEKVVTGHYARVERDAQTGEWRLKKALDPQKDQSYVLYFLGQRELDRLLLPLGALTKPRVREIARDLGLRTAAKPDSQDICFVRGSCGDFVERFLGETSPPGAFVDMSGKVIGEHRGMVRYTVGQRRGLGVFSERPLYVVRMDPKANQITLGHEEDLYTSELFARDFHFVSDIPPAFPLRCKAKIRYRHPEQDAVARREGNLIKITFDRPQRAVTNGQSVVLYDGEDVLGGGIITNA